jgi:chain length determinant protein tyrosine kinase EpsG
MKGLTHIKPGTSIAPPTRASAVERPVDRSRAMGTILVANGRLTNGDVARILDFAEERRLRFGDAGVQLELLNPDDVAFALARQFSNPVLSRGGLDGVSDDLLAGYDPQSALLEPLRNLRSQLMLRWYQESTRRVLSIVSPEREEGRSWLVANLAATFSHIGVRTLIIDADLRQPRQQRIFNLQGAGLCELLTGRAGGDVARRIHPHLRLFVVGAGNVPPNPQELLSRAIFEAVVSRFAAQFDLVLLDTPPAAESADAQIISAHAQSALMLARKGHTTRALLSETMRNLKQAGVSVVGSVMSEH